MKKLKRFLVLISSAFALFACSPGSLSIGSVITSGSDGFFRRDLQYVATEDLGISRYVESFSKDGVFYQLEQVAENLSDLDFDGNIEEEWATVWGQRGTYTYDSDSFVLTVNLNAYIDVDEGVSAWASFGTNYDASTGYKSWSGSYVFYDHTYLECYVSLPDNLYRRSRGFERHNGEIVSYHYDYVITLSDMEFTYLKETETNGVSNFHTFYQDETSFDVLSYQPADLTGFEEGCQVQLRAVSTMSLNQRYTNDSASSVYYTNSSGSLSSYEFYHYGDFLTRDVYTSFEP